MKTFYHFLMTMVWYVMCLAALALGTLFQLGGPGIMFGGSFSVYDFFTLILVCVGSFSLMRSLDFLKKTLLPIPSIYGYEEQAGTCRRCGAEGVGLPCPKCGFILTN